MVINMLKYIFLNRLRFFIRIIKKNKFKVLPIIIGIIIFLLFSVEFYNLIPKKYLEFLPLIFFIYCIFKLFQDIPTMNISYQMIEFKLLTLSKLKGLILIKSILPSIILFILIHILNLPLNEKTITQVNVVLLINIIINIVCFLVYQVKRANILKFFTLIICSALFYFSLLYVTTVLVVSSIVVFLSKRYFVYDVILPYYHIMGNMTLALVNADIESLSKNQLKIIKSKPSSNLKLIEKYYSNDLLFFISKEISRTLYYSKKLIIIGSINLLCVLSVLMYTFNPIISSFALFIITMTSGNMLTTLNQYESINKNTGFYFPYSLKDVIKQKYIAHLIILLPLFIPSLILKDILFTSIIGCILLLPIKNTLESFSSHKGIKLLSYTINSVVFLLCFLNIYI